MAHEMHTPKGVMEPCMMGSGIYQVRKAHLRDPAEPLEKRMGDQIKN
jgi:hypothetical protein